MDDRTADIPRSHRHLLWLPMVVGQFAGVLLLFFLEPMSYEDWQAFGFQRIAMFPLELLRHLLGGLGYRLQLSAAQETALEIAYWPLVGMAAGLLVTLLCWRPAPPASPGTGAVARHRPRPMRIALALLVAVVELHLLVFGSINRAAHCYGPTWLPPVPGVRLAPSHTVIILEQHTNDPAFAKILNIPLDIHEPDWQLYEKHGSTGLPRTAWCPNPKGWVASNQVVVRGFMEAVWKVTGDAGADARLYSDGQPGWQAAHKARFFAEYAARQGRPDEAVDWYAAIARTSALMIHYDYGLWGKDICRSIRIVAPWLAASDDACARLEGVLVELRQAQLLGDEMQRVSWYLARQLAEDILDGKASMPGLFQEGHTATVDRVAIPVPLYRALLGSTREKTLRHIDEAMTHIISPPANQTYASSLEWGLFALDNRHTLDRGNQEFRGWAFASGDDPVAKRALLARRDVPWIGHEHETLQYQLDVTRVHLALRRFQAAHQGRPPDTLAELVPRYFAALPRSSSYPEKGPRITNDFCYRSSGTNWIVYSSPVAAGGTMSPTRATNYPFTDLLTNRACICFPSIEDTSNMGSF